MLIQKHNKRLIGQILVDGGFLLPHRLDAALEEQKHTNELLGQVLVRMGILDPSDIQAALSIQGHLNRREDAVRIAAGVRQMLGALLVQAGRITREQLERAIAEQKKSGEKLGEVLVRQGLLTMPELEGVLDFQQNQSPAKPSPGPLRLGEILISAGTISRGQLEDALRKQAASRKKLGEVLIEEGYAEPHHIKRGIRLQQMLLAAVLAALLTACGAGGGQPAAAVDANSIGSTSSADIDPAPTNYLTVTYDEYGLLQPNYYYSTSNDAFWSIQSNVAENAQDPNFKTIIRIDISKSEQGGMPSLGNKTFSLEDDPRYEKFPGVFVVFNGERSVLKKVDRGTVTFTADSTAFVVTGDFDVMLTDNDSILLPPPEYRLKGIFHFKMGINEPAVPSSVAVP